MKFVPVLAQLYVKKHEAKCSLLIARHFLLFCTLLTGNTCCLIENLRLCSSTKAGIVLKF